ncbi:hypothetical protein FQN50_002680 [Emmonsiellopsis sp. PD_5]|nr:hypothetical protein FQN50_002680 [Emmonsiellopsis sp. PD_5]
MSRNRRAVFGDPPSPYLAAVIERNRRAREARERCRRANEEDQNDEELPRKKSRSRQAPAPAPSSADYHWLCTPPSRRDPLVWMGPRSPRGGLGGGYAVSGSGVSNFGDSESNGGTESEGDDSSLYDAGGTSEGSDGDDQDGGDGGNGDEGQGGQDEGGSGVEGDQDNASDYRNDDDDSSMVDDGDENTAIHGNNLFSDQATANTRHDLEGGSSRNRTPVNHDSPILMNKTLCIPSLMDIDNEDFIDSNPYPIPNQHFHQSLHKQGYYPPHPTHRRPTHHPFSVPGSIFIDPIDFDDDELRTEAHEYLRWAAAAVAFQRPEHIIENSSSDQNIPPAQDVLPQPASISRPLEINRYNPIAQPRRGSQVGGAPYHMYQYQIEGIADPHSAVIGVGNRNGGFHDHVVDRYQGDLSSGQDDQAGLGW